MPITGRTCDVAITGLQRTDAAYGALFGAAGFRLSGIVPLDDAAQFSIFEGVPAGAASPEG